jgi:hypothetical protein
VPDPERIITAGHGNKTARTVGIREGETINAAALTAMFRQIIANNRAGGWRKLKSSVRCFLPRGRGGGFNWSLQRFSWSGGRCGGCWPAAGAEGGAGAVLGWDQVGAGFW